LQRPQWVIVNGAFDVLDPTSRRRIEALFKGPLSDVSVISIGPDVARNPFFTRTLYLVTDLHGPTFRPDEQLAASSA
jgi:putative ATP-binding cassette transporter